MKKIIFFLTALLLIILPTSASYAADGTNSLTGTWSPTPQHDKNWAPKPDPKGQYKDGDAWFTDVNGNKKKVDKINIDSSGHEVTNSTNTMSPMDFSSGSYIYIYNNYSQTTSELDKEHYPIGSVEVYNQSSSAGTLSYTQQNTKVNTWSVSSQISGTAEFKVDFLAKLQGTFGMGFTSSNTTSQSTTVTWTMTVGAGQHGEIDAFLKAGFSGGTAAYSKYLIQNDISKYVGTYSEYDSGWAPSQNNIYYHPYTW